MDVTPTEPFARLLRAHRLARDLTQEQLAKAAGVSVRSIRNAELGHSRKPRIEAVRRLATALALGEQEADRFTTAARSPAPRVVHVVLDDAGVQADLVEVTLPPQTEFTVSISVQFRAP